jgi:hypothetical protein
MLTNGAVNPALLSQVLGTSQATDSAQRAVLSTEIASDPTHRGYAGKSRAQVLELVNSPYTGPNPTPAGRIPRVSCTTGEFAALASSAGARVAAMPTPPAEVVFLLDKVVPLMMYQDSIDLTNPLVVGQLPALVAIGALLQSEVDDLTTVPNTSWQSTLDFPARSVVLFGSGAVVEMADLAAVGVP